MQPGHLKLKFKMKRERSWDQNNVSGQILNSIHHPGHISQRNHGSTSYVPTTQQNPIIDLSDDSPEDNGTSDNHPSDNGNGNMQLVLYEPPPGNDDDNNNSREIVPSLSRSELPPLRRNFFPGQQPRVLPAVGAFTVQCANCYKWRLIPTKEKYEEIREHILEQPFLCETAREWRPSISCDVDADIEQDSSRLWAIDKPNIAQPPPGWQRLLRIRGEGSTKFADVYYQSPTGKRLRSMVEIQKYLMEHPEYTEAGVSITQFSFQIPRPLQENYVRRRPARPPTFLENGATEVPPLAWAGPDEDTNLRLGVSEPRRSYEKGQSSEPSKKKKTPTKKRFDGQQQLLGGGTRQVNMDETFRYGAPF